MKKLLTLLTLLFIVHSTFGQNWNCFLPAQKQFFTNSNNYLRGMRIDSVRTNGTDTVYYPFHSIRGYINLVVAIDSNGGSWLGKKVIEQTDGTFLFDDIWNDTVIIKTQANIGDSWIFYNDTSSVYYVANVVSADTASIIGVLDSVKNISITAYNGTNVVSNSPINNLSIVLSKNHGFVKVFDLYTFPYHDSDYGYTNFNDYFFYMVSTVHGFPPFSGPNFSPYTINSYQQFTQVSFHYPSQDEIYSYNPGDIIGGTYCYTSGYGQYYCQNGIDSIITKTNITNGTSYTARIARQTVDYPQQSAPVYSTVSYGSSSFQYTDTTLLFDSTKMPEEWNAAYSYYFVANDSSNCFVSNLYEFDNSYVYQDYSTSGGFPILFEYCGIDINIYKVGVGIIDVETYWGDPFPTPPAPGCWSEISKGWACKKNGIACSGCPTLGLGVQGLVSSQNSIQVYPNPANDELSVKMPDNAAHTIYLLNMLGQTVYSLQTQLAETSISVSGLAEGVYIIKVADENGVGLSKKVIIQH